MIRKVQADEARDPPYPEGFDGEVGMQPLHRPGEAGGAEVVAIFFSPGARTRPHTHETEQVLHCLEGSGVVATRSERRPLRPGDVAVIPAGEWHWHGATPDSAMCHISIKVPSGTDWSQPLGEWDRYTEGMSDG